MPNKKDNCPIPAKKAKESENVETDDRISEEEQSRLDEELLMAAKECFIIMHSSTL